MAVKYIPYEVSTVKGQAVLNNFHRLLKYEGNDEVLSHIRRGMSYYELNKVEHVGKDKQTDNMVIRGECISACAYLKEKGIKVDLVYIDPPFASNADYSKKIILRQNVVKDENKDSDSFIGDDGSKEFEEVMYGDVWTKEYYLNWMFENLRAIKEVLSDNGSIYVHLDRRIGHYVKILLDEVFGEENFVNEIIWQYFMGGKGLMEFAQKHDDIYFYAKSKGEHVFNKFNIKRYLDFKPSLKNESKSAIDDEENGKDEIGYYSIVACPDVWQIKSVFNMGYEDVGYAT